VQCTTIFNSSFSNYQIVKCSNVPFRPDNNRNRHSSGGAYSLGFQTTYRLRRILRGASLSPGCVVNALPGSRLTAPDSRKPKFFSSLRHASCIVHLFFFPSSCVVCRASFFLPCVVCRLSCIVITIPKFSNWISPIRNF
jgi:hypothetical protein